MAENLANWPSGHRKAETSGHRLVAERIPFPRGLHGGRIATNLEVIWEMPVKKRLPEPGILADAPLRR
jgi:hypothetical protein